jgi:hypothetical protein
MNWSLSSLWQKAKIYAERAHKQSRDSALFPFWSSLAMEFLARAALAKISPALLADPRGEESMMYAFNFPAKEPKSIPMQTVLKRCRVMVPGFSEELSKSVQALVNLRNEELHTGKAAFDDYPNRLWLTDYYRSSRVLLLHLGKSLEDFLGKPEANAAQKMIDAADEKIAKEVQGKINKARGMFESLDAEVQKQKRKDGELEVHWKNLIHSKAVVCPACGAQALLNGNEVNESEPRLEGDDVVMEFFLLPSKFECFTCSLEIEGYGKLNAAGLGGQYTYEFRQDATEHYANRGELDDWDAYGND